MMDDDREPEQTETTARKIRKVVARGALLERRPWETVVEAVEKTVEIMEGKRRVIRRKEVLPALPGLGARTVWTWEFEDGSAYEISRGAER